MFSDVEMLEYDLGIPLGTISYLIDDLNEIEADYTYTEDMLMTALDGDIIKYECEVIGLPCSNAGVN